MTPSRTPAAPTQIFVSLVHDNYLNIRQVISDFVAFPVNNLRIKISINTGKCIKRSIFRSCFYCFIFSAIYLEICGPGSSVGIASEVRAGRSGIVSRGGRDFPPVQTGPGAHPLSCTMDTVSFLGIEAAVAWV
jgi:hypothetical protein